MVTRSPTLLALRHETDQDASGDNLVGKVPIWISLPFIATVCAVSIAASLWNTRGRH